MMSNTCAESHFLQPETISYERHFNRIEVKFLVDHKTLPSFFSLISQYIQRDPRGREKGCYNVTSLYYDSPKLTFFWEKMDGLLFRRKLRLRVYDRESSQCFLEIKQRIDRSTQKRRLLGLMEDFVRGLDQREHDNYWQTENTIYDEALVLVSHYNLLPRLFVSYRREAFFGVFERGLRITVDRNLRCEKYFGSLLPVGHASPFFLSPQFVVLEVKYNNRIPSWLCSALNFVGMQAVTFSKYCHAVDRLEFRGSLL